MTARMGMSGGAFKRAMVISAAAHSLLLLIIILNPSLPKPARKDMIQYISMSNFGPSGGGGAIKTAPQTELGATEVKKETLRDLTTIQKLQPSEPQSELRYPVDKPKKEPPKIPDKKAVITKPDPSAKTAPAKEAASGQGREGAGVGGTGLTIGLGGTGEGEGGGSFGDLGLSNFPYNYYIVEIQTKIQSNWFQALVDPGASGTFHVDVYFRIFKDGSISKVEIKESSGLMTLDQSAVRAVMQSAKFPPLPPGYNEEYLGIYLRFEHSK